MNTRVPRYHRIAESLRDRIRGGRLTPGTRLDNQRALAKSFGVTLMTLRQALEVLERENLIARRHGLGTSSPRRRSTTTSSSCAGSPATSRRRASTSPRASSAAASPARIIA